MFHQVYLDVQPVNTTWHLESIRALNLSTYHYAYERQAIAGNKPRLRIGAIGPNLAEVIPDAVEIVPKRTLPPLEKGGDPITLQNVPVVNEQTLFMYGLGATKELINSVETLKENLSNQVDRVMDLYGETTRLEHLMSRSSNGEAELRMRAAAAEAETLRIEMEMEIKMAKDEEEFMKKQKESELSQIHRNDQLTSERLRKEDELARLRTKEDLRVKFESNRRLEAARNNAALLLSEMEYERDVALQKATEDLKAQTAKVSAIISLPYS